MSAPHSPPKGGAPEQPIVIHGPMTGDADRIAAHPRTVPAKPGVDMRVVSDTDVVGPLRATGVEAPPAEPVVAEAVVHAPAKPATVVSVAPTERVFGLDAFRGILLLAMNFTFTIPPWGPFAKWMYHTQVPPSPTREYVNVPGLTWQDLLFAMFVFTMAAAIPIAMSGRLAKGKPYPDIVVQSIKRGAMLLLFALLIGHVNPYWTQDYTKRGNVLALAGLLVSFAVFVQPRPTWKPAAVRALRNFGWAGVVALLFVIPWLYGQHFASERRDYIMAALAFATVAGTVVWLFTRANLKLRVLLLGLVVLGRTLAQNVDFVAGYWFANPLPFVYQPWYLDLLLLVIPGTIAGDLIWRWMKAREDRQHAGAWSPQRLALLATLGFAFLPVLLFGLYERRYPLATLVGVAVVSALLLVAARNPATPRDRVLAHLFGWSALWLVLGMLAEPLEGGIRKDPQTLGFLLIMAGAAKASLGALLIVADTFAAGRRGLKPVALIGQNALFAYVVYMLGFEHLLWLTGIGDAFTSTWPLATMRSVVLTLLVALVVWAATRKRLIWKA